MSARRRGFTLVEAIATMGVLSIVGSLSSLLIFETVNGYARASDGARAHAEASAAADRLLRAWRDITAVAGVPSIASVSASGMTWNTDWSVALDASTIEFVQDGSVERSLATGVTGFAIRAFDDANAALTLPLSGAGCADIQRLEVTITVARGQASSSVRSKVFIRELMSGASE